MISQEFQAHSQWTLPGYDPTVFYVSTVDYWSIREQPREISSPHLKLSGILELRKHCMAVLGSSLQRAATGYIKTQIPAFLADISLFLQASPRTTDTLRSTEEKLKHVSVLCKIWI